MSRHYPTRSLARLVLLSGLAASSVQADVVTDWNSVALDAVIAAREAQPTQARSVTAEQCSLASPLPTTSMMRNAATSKTAVR